MKGWPAVGINSLAVLVGRAVGVRRWGTPVGCAGGDMVGFATVECAGVGWSPMPNYKVTAPVAISM